MLKNKLIQPKSLLLIFLSVLIIISLTVFHELHESRDEALSILKSQAHSLLETMMTSSGEVLTASEEVENEINKRLLNNASIIKLLLEEQSLSNDLLQKIAEKNKLHRINIFNSKGILTHSNFQRGRRDNLGLFSKEFLAPIYSNEQDTVIVGLREARMQKGYRYIVALATDDNGAIVLNLDAEELMEFRQRIGFGILLNRLTNSEGIVYTALEDSSGILAASANVESLDNIIDSQFLLESIRDKMFNWRFSEFDSTEIFEAVHPFDLEGNTIGIFRIGLSLNPLNAVYDRITTRIIISAVFLLILGTFLITIVFTRQNFDILKRKYSYIESFSNQLIKNANDVILVLDENKTIVDINPSGMQFFKLDVNDHLEKKLDELVCPEAESKIFSSASNIIETICVRGNQKNHLLISRSEFYDSEKKLNYVLIIKDLTSIKELEEQIERGKQLTAMGHLASGVAHEIRNPLNAISTIVQQLSRDFEPVEDKEDYLSFTNLIYKEVKRINKTIESFLKLAKPVPIKKEVFKLDEFLEDIALQYNNVLKENNIEFIMSNSFHGSVNWDKDQIKQVLINIINNARDAIKQQGKIHVNVEKVSDLITIVVEDNGKGIPEENMNKIFNLYFTTKAEGTGIGLGITQRIINEHSGIITVDSKEGEGTKFTIKLNSE